MSATSGDPARGRQLFISGTAPACSGCHTLAAAGAQGKIGPDLDAAFGPDRCGGFKESTIRDLIRGQIAYADSNTGTGVPGMPANLATGQKAKDIAAYVASVAGVTSGPGPHWDCATGAEVTASS